MNGQPTTDHGQHRRLVLGIETSCDETSVAIVDPSGRVRTNLIASQIERHRPFGGVVPEIASREHLQHLMPLLDRALQEASAGLGDLSAIAVTAGPGLIGALLVGVAAAQGLSYGLGIPLVAVNHLEGHIFSSYLRSDREALALPPRFLALVVSGGHSSVYDVTTGSGISIRMLNRTRDDAAGEAFDKVGKFIGLPYPAGPQIERLAASGDDARYPFTLAQFKEESSDFSFSGLKATAIRLARREGLEGVAPRERSPEAEQQLADFCASFQRAIGDQIVDRLEKVWAAVGSSGEAPGEIALAGGVAANGHLRARVSEWGGENRLVVRLPDRHFCTDNGAMIAFAGLKRFEAGETADARRVPVRSRLPIGV